MRINFNLKSIEKKKVISFKNIRTKNPLWATAMWIMMFDYWQAPQWLWGVCGCLFFLLWSFWIASFWTEESIDIFKEKGTK